MNAKLLPSKRTYLAGLLGATILIAGPALARADQGKWWTPKERASRPTVERDRPGDRGSRRGVIARRGWYGGPVFQDRIVIRGGYGRPYFMARRYYVRPYFRRRVIFVRPVRYFIAANMCIRGFSLSARFHSRDHYEYGCNFCDARFDNYDDYVAHVESCAHAPDGYRVAPLSWDDRDSNGDWNAPTDDCVGGRSDDQDRDRLDDQDRSRMDSQDRFDSQDRDRSDEDTNQ